MTPATMPQPGSGGPEVDPQFTATGATSAELTAAVATINAALAAKQASATAATDAELAAAVADLEALVAAVEPGAEYALDSEVTDAIAAHAAGDATDAELAAAVASLTTDLAAKQAASTAATDAELAAHAADASLHSSGRDLAYVERTSALTNQTNTSYLDTGLAIPDFTVGVRPVYVELLIHGIQFGTSAIPVFALTDASNNVIVEQQAYEGVNFAQVGFRMERRITAAGAYSGRKIRHKVNSGQSFSILAPANGAVPARVRVFEA